MNLSQPYYIEPRTGKAHISLNGEWDFTFTPDRTEPSAVIYDMKANVPGTVFRQLHEAGRMPEPYTGVNSRQFAWVDDMVWYYRKTFTMPDLAGRLAFFCMNGSCYYTSVWINGQFVGDHEGMFGGPVCEVQRFLHAPGENEIVIACRACNWHNPDFTSRNQNLNIPAPIVPWNLMRDRDSLCGDFNVIGPWGDIRLELIPPIHLSRPYLYTDSISGDTARLHFEVEISDPSVDELHAHLSSSDPGWTEFTFSFSQGNLGIRQDRSLDILIEMTAHTTGNLVYTCRETYTPFDWEKSRTDPRYYECHHFRKDIILEHPDLWMPAALGNPDLYDVTVSLFDGSVLLDTLSFQTGIRTIRRDMTRGEMFRTRWDRFWFIINETPVFLTGVNWMPIDLFLCLRPEEYRWSLECARDLGIMIIRVWSGGGIPETDLFYSLCDELGILVWQDHSIANMDTSNWDMDVLLNQECMNLFRIRNHPSLCIHCGGNELNPYSRENLAAISVIEHAVEDLDPAREWVRTTPDKGSAHIYMDMEPTWYRMLSRQIPFVAESGIHSFPSMKALRRVVCQEEIERPLPDLFSPEFEEKDPELRNHFVEYIPERIPRMLARASAITDIRNILLPDLVEASQIASLEFYQIMIESLRENYPVTTGVMPWVYRRPTTAVGIQLMDGYGQPIPPYYAVRNAYRPINVSLKLEHLSLYPGETIPLTACVINASRMTFRRLYLEMHLFSPSLEVSGCIRREITLAPNTPDMQVDLGEITMTEDYTDRYFLIRLRLMNEKGCLVQKVYWPRCLSLLADPAVRRTRREAPAPNLMIENGPWLKNQISGCSGAVLRAEVRASSLTTDRQMLAFTVSNTGTVPAFPVSLDSDTLPCVCEDNYFLLAPGETRTIAMTVFRKQGKKESSYTIRAWNAPPVILSPSVE